MNTSIAVAPINAPNSSIVSLGPIQAVRPPPLSFTAVLGIALFSSRFAARGSEMFTHAQTYDLHAPTYPLTPSRAGREATVARAP